MKTSFAKTVILSMALLLFGSGVASTASASLVSTVAEAVYKSSKLKPSSPSFKRLTKRVWNVTKEVPADDIFEAAIETPGSASGLTLMNGATVTAPVTLEMLTPGGWEALTRINSSPAFGNFYIPLIPSFRVYRLRTISYSGLCPMTGYFGETSPFLVIPKQNTHIDVEIFTSSIFTYC